MPSRVTQDYQEPAPSLAPDFDDIMKGIDKQTFNLSAAYVFLKLCHNHQQRKNANVIASACSQNGTCGSRKKPLKPNVYACLLKEGSQNLSLNCLKEACKYQTSAFVNKNKQYSY